MISACTCFYLGERSQPGSCERCSQAMWEAWVVWSSAPANLRPQPFRRLYLESSIAEAQEIERWHSRKLAS